MMMEDDNVDRISDLPDSLIHHILSLLPSTREAVQTTILSKRWQHLWTCLPVLIFHSPPAMSYGTFLKFIDNTLFLHDCNKIKKLELIYRYKVIKKDFRFSTKIRFATTKHVEQLILHSVHQEYVLPTFLFKDATSLLELRTYKCSFMLNGKVDWKCLTTLILVSCRLFDQAMELILSGTPELKIITLDNCVGFEKLVIASNSLKRLLLETCLGVFDLDISCPKLEILYLLGVLNVRNVKLRNLPSLLYAGIAFNPHTDERTYVRIILIIDILQQLQHVKVLLFGNSFMKYVPTVLGGSGQLSAVLNITSMTLLLRNISGIACLVRRSPMLEILAIHETHYDQDYRDFGEKYWSDVTVFSCLAYLKTIKITGFPKEDGQHKVMLNFIEIFLKNARVLEKMVITLEDDGTGFPLKVAQELLSLPRCSPYAIIKLICSK